MIITLGTLPYLMSVSHPALFCIGIRDDAEAFILELRTRFDLLRNHMQIPIYSQRSIKRIVLGPNKPWPLW